MSTIKIFSSYFKDAFRSLKLFGRSVVKDFASDHLQKLINNNPNNPVIHMRSFGEDKFQVAQNIQRGCFRGQYRIGHL